MSAVQRNFAINGIFAAGCSVILEAAREAMTVLTCLTDAVMKIYLNDDIPRGVA
jgi:hypothetical protein